MQTLFGFVVAISLLVFVHEWGHFVVARWCGVRVLRFSIGFGQPVLRWQRRPDSTEWVLCWIPLGGYVRMLDEREAPVPAELLGQAFNRKPVLQRMAVVVAGPLVNLLMAVVLYAAVGMIGTRQIAPVIDTPVPASTAQAAGLMRGDTIEAIEVGGQWQTIRSWQDIRWQMVRAAGEAEVQLRVLRQGRTLEMPLRLPPGKADVDEAWFHAIGLRWPDSQALIARVLPDGAAQAAGLQAGDVITAVNGKAIETATELRGLLRDSAGKKLEVSVQRKDRSVLLSLTPTVKTEGRQSFGYVGAMIGSPPPTVLVQLGGLGAIAHGISQTWQMSALTLKMIGHMIVGQASLKQLSGPLSIAQYAGESVSLGLTAYLGFLAVVSVSLGVLNLLPIPILDGGHLLYYSVEFVRGKALPEAWELLGQRVGMVLLAAMMLVAVSNDLIRMLGH